MTIDPCVPLVKAGVSKTDCCPATDFCSGLCHQSTSDETMHIMCFIPHYLTSVKLTLIQVAQMLQQVQLMLACVLFEEQEDPMDYLFLSVLQLFVPMTGLQAMMLESGILVQTSIVLL